METMRAYKFRIYPDRKRQEAIDASISMSQRLYNKLLEKTIDVHKRNPSSKISQRTINQFLNEIIKEDKTYLQLYAHVRVDIRNRLLKNYKNFFRRCQQKNAGAKIKAGFPRFKSKGRFNSITHIENNGSFNFEKAGKKEMLRISKIGGVQIEKHRNIIGNVKTMTIKREGNNYYAIFTAEQTINPPKIEDTDPIGIDMGLNSFIAISDGTKVEKPKFARKKEKKLAHWQSVIAKKDITAKKQKRSKYTKNRAKAIDHLQEEWREVNNQSNDFAHKLSNKIVNSGYTSFAVENLNIQSMLQNHSLARSIQNASWNRFAQMLSYKAESAGMKVIKVDPRNTSKTCSNCGSIRDMPLFMREYDCDRCGMQLDRDINASINILKRAREGHSRSNASGDATSATQRGLQAASVNQEHTLQPIVAGEAPNL